MFYPFWIGIKFGILAYPTSKVADHTHFGRRGHDTFGIPELGQLSNWNVHVGIRSGLTSYKSVNPTGYTRKMFL